MEKIDLYNLAKDAYYNGEEILDDYEFDELERELGLENKSYVGTVSSSYTVQHPIVMGTLQKEQIKEKNGEVEWNKHFNNILNYLRFSLEKEDSKVIVTPKYDGCSFEVVINNGDIVSISTRGSKDKGKDISQFLEPLVRKGIDFTDKNFIDSEWIIRGEILVDKKVFKEKYNQEFTNPRSFVSSVIGQKFNDNDEEQKKKVNDLSLVIYDTKKKADVWYDICFADVNFINTDFLPSNSIFIDKEKFTESTFNSIYGYYADIRDDYKYALDGFVLKVWTPNMETSTDERPNNSIAVKFMPLLQTTIVRDIEWSLGKSDGKYAELYPTLVFDKIVLDNKEITRATASNFGKLYDNKITVGTEIIVSLAGDIIPYIYKVTKPYDGEDDLGISILNTVPYSLQELCGDEKHLFKLLDEKEKNKIDFLMSARVLDIKGIGDVIAEKMFNNYQVNNILEYPNEEIDKCFDKKTHDNVLAALEYAKENITLEKVIQSCNIYNCGARTSEKCADYIVFGFADFKGFDKKSYEWCLDDESDWMKKLRHLVYDVLHKDFESLHIHPQNIQDDRIPIIMTGSPNNYKNKKDFLAKNQQYKETSSFEECKILFTNDITSETSNMKKAKKLVIEIQLY